MAERDERSRQNARCSREKRKGPALFHPVCFRIRLILRNAGCTCCIRTEATHGLKGHAMTVLKRRHAPFPSSRRKTWDCTFVSRLGTLLSTSPRGWRLERCALFDQVASAQRRSDGPAFSSTNSRTTCGSERGDLIWCQCRKVRPLVFFGRRGSHRCFPGGDRASAAMARARWANDGQPAGEGFGGLLTRGVIRDQFGGQISRDWAPGDGSALGAGAAAERLMSAYLMQAVARR